MRPISQDDLLLLAAAYLHMPARRLRALVRGEDQALKEWITGESARKVAHARHQAREAAARLVKLGASIVSISDAAYPAGLRDLEDPPAFLCVRGELPQSGIAIVGSRTPPSEAAAFARDLAMICGMPVVSGLATGIDAAAHHGALDAHLPTVAYVGTGLGVTYPPEHRALEDEIAKRGGAVASERLPDEPVTKWALVHRDRLQAAHAVATVLIASEIDGGAMQTMKFAKELGRARFVLDAKGDPGYSGNVQALADGAIALPRDAVDAMKKIRASLTHAKESAASANPRRPRAAR
ncbi:MAG TPA: DNA-processing protein DprA [Candidatus Baltobacteraceae bacterium]|jgi:DNA processing protein|nr:DNA-processing protein DprA [Candidatus Baltobacteraceae bacterium]